MSLKVKIIQGDDLEKVEKEVNDFGEVYIVRASQSHVSLAGSVFWFTFVLFYEERRI